MFELVQQLRNKVKELFTMLRRTVMVATVSQVDSELRRGESHISQLSHS